MLNNAVPDAPFTPAGWSTTPTFTQRSNRQRWGDSINVLDVGADPTGTATNFHTVLATAWAEAIARSRSEIIIPPGRYKYSAAPSALYGNTNKVKIRGHGPGVTVLAPDFASGNWFSIGDQAQSQVPGLLIEGLSFVPNATHTGGYGTDIKNAKDLDFRDVEWAGARQGVRLGNGAAAVNNVVYVDFRDCFGAPNANSTNLAFFDLCSCGEVSIRGNPRWNGNGLARFVEHTDTSYNCDGLEVTGGVLENWRQYVRSQAKGIVNLQWSNTMIDRFDTAFNTGAASGGANTNWTITGNKLLSASTGLTSSGGASTGILWDDSAGEANTLTVVGNTFEYIGGHCIYSLAGSLGAMISGNNFFRSGQSGVALIRIASTVANVVGNIGQTYAGTTAYTYGIQWDGSTSSTRDATGNMWQGASSGNETGTK